MTELKKVPRETLPANREAMITLAIEKGADLDKIEKLMELQERFEKNEARKAYHIAMTDFKANPPEIDKDRHVSFKTSKGTTEYHHATLANVTEKIIKALSEHGLSHGWKTDQHENGKVTVECVITHEQGHSESTKLTADPDNSGSKNPIQALGSTITYLERYTLLALCGLATYDQDNDGGTVDRINEKQLSTIIDMINNLGVNEEDFLAFMNVDSLEMIPENDFSKAMKALKEKEKRLKNGN